MTNSNNQQNRPIFDIPPFILSGNTSDHELTRTIEVLRKENLNPDVVVDFEFFDEGILSGIAEVSALLKLILPEKTGEAWALEDGMYVNPG